MTRGMRAHSAIPPSTVRRSPSVVGDVRIYQELIRLAVMRKRLLSERARGVPNADSQIDALDAYRDDLYHRLGLQRIVPAARPVLRQRQQSSGDPPKEANASPGIAGIQELRYCRDR